LVQENRKKFAICKINNSCRGNEQLFAINNAYFKNKINSLFARNKILFRRI